MGKSIKRGLFLSAFMPQNATGIVETKAVKDTMAAMSEDPSKLSHGTLVDPNLVAVNHDHYFSYRLDLDVDGQNNSFMIDRLVPEKITGQVRSSIWAVQSSTAKTENINHQK